MDKINFVNNSEPDLDAQTLNQMQTNIENAIPAVVDNLTSESTIDSLSANQGRILANTINGMVEQGEWTPMLKNLGEDTGPTVNYIQQAGIYIKINKLVIVFFSLRGKITATTGTNYASIRNLPYQNQMSSMGSGNFSVIYNLTNDTLTSSIQIVNKSLSIRVNSGGGGSTTFFKTSGDSNFECSGMASYIIN